MAETEPTRPSGRVLLFGDDMRIFLAVARSLGRAGTDVHAVPFNWEAPALSSRYITTVHYLPRHSDDAESWLAAVRRLVDQHHFDLVIPCCDDRSILAFDRHRDQFAHVRVAIPRSNAMDLLFDKAKTRGLCSELGIPVANGRILRSEDTAEDLAARFGLPLVLKPARSYSLDRLDIVGKVFIVDSGSELGRLLPTISRREQYLVEQHFQGVGIGVSVLADHGRILNAFQHRRLREGKGGSSSHRISETINPGLLAACEKIVAATEFTGPCMFEFRSNTETERWILLETNARFWGSLPLPVSLGVDFPAYLYDLLVHQIVHPQIPYPEGIRSRNVMLDALNLISELKRSRGRHLGRWLLAAAGFACQPLGWITGRETSDSFAPDDLKPALAECAQLVPTVLEKRSRERLGAPRRRRSEQSV